MAAEPTIEAPISSHLSAEIVDVAATRIAFAPCLSWRQSPRFSRRSQIQATHPAVARSLAAVSHAILSGSCLPHRRARRSLPRARGSRVVHSCQRDESDEQRDKHERDQRPLDESGSPGDTRRCVGRSRPKVDGDRRVLHQEIDAPSHDGEPRHHRHCGCQPVPIPRFRVARGKRTQRRAKNAVDRGEYEVERPRLPRSDETCRAHVSRASRSAAADPARWKPS